MTDLDSVCGEALATPGLVLALTGAGLSSESGIPTFRGPEGYWRVGSVNHHPQELATRAAFERMPADVWRWYLHRLEVCSRAAPNRGHRELVRLDALLGERFILLTQNVDGLHGEAGSPAARTFEIHGNLRYMRCSRRCGAPRERVPTSLPGEATPDELETRLRCTRCEAWMRPFVLWFDECYDEENYHFESAIEAAREATLLLIVGTTGTTNLPRQVANLVASRGGTLLAIDPTPTAFSELCERSTRGHVLTGTASEWLPPIVDALSQAVRLKPSVP